MDEANGDETTEDVGNGGWVKRLLLPAAGVTLAVAVTAVLFVYRDSVAELGDTGYLGSFLVGLIANGTVILPMPGVLPLFVLGMSFNPWLIGITASAGGAIGELTGYAVGSSGRRMLRNNPAYIRAVGWVRKWGIWVLFLFTVTPLPVDFVGIAAGALRFPIWKFLLVCWLGKAIFYTSVALAGRWVGDQADTGAFDTRAIWIAGGAALAALALLALALLVERWNWRRG